MLSLFKDPFSPETALKTHSLGLHWDPQSPWGLGQTSLAHKSRLSPNTTSALEEQ